jgi:head-tail adaptor
MSLGSLMRRTVTVVTPGIRITAAGDTAEDWTTATRRTTSAWISPDRGRETNRALRDTITAEWTLIVGPLTPITAHDRVEYQGRTFQVTAHPEDQYSPRGPHHTTVTLTEWRG